MVKNFIQQSLFFAVLMMASLSWGKPAPINEKTKKLIWSQLPLVVTMDSGIDALLTDTGKVEALSGSDKNASRLELGAWALKKDSIQVTAIEFSAYACEEVHCASYFATEKRIKIAVKGDKILYNGKEAALNQGQKFWKVLE
jgi:hypothetical protein